MVGKLRHKISIDEIERNPKWVKMDITNKDICDLEIPKDKMYDPGDDEEVDFSNISFTEKKRKTFEETQSKKTVQGVMNNVLSYYMPDCP